MSLLMWNYYRTYIQVPNNTILRYEKDILSNHMMGRMMGLKILQQLTFWTKNYLSGRGGDKWPLYIHRNCLPPCPYSSWKGGLTKFSLLWPSSFFPVVPSRIVEHQYRQWFAIALLYLFIRYALKHFRQFMNIKLCSDWLNYICTIPTQLLYAGTHAWNSLVRFGTHQRPINTMHY